MADWDEIKRLAADFQLTQTSETLQRLSERNCIDIVKKLTDLNLIELIYTCDGKEFITPSHLIKEIEDEIYVNGGRMHLHDLASKLNVDYQHIENQTRTLISDKPEDYTIILGQIIHCSYRNSLAKQINDSLIVNGQLSIAEFAKTLDLPSEFLLENVSTEFVVSHDNRTFYTPEMMDRYKSIIVGTFTAVSRPTSLASVMKRLDIPERIFMPTIEGLMKEGRLDASIENRQFIPAVYTRDRNDYIDKFFSCNSYIEYDLLSRMDIKQPKTFLKKRFPDGIALKTCFISPTLVSQVESMVEDTLASNGWIDITSVVPPTIQPEDIEDMLTDLFKKNKQLDKSCCLIEKVNVCSLGHIAACKGALATLMEPKAQEHLKNGKLMAHFIGTVPLVAKEQKKEQEPALVKDDKQEATSEPEQKHKSKAENEPTKQDDGSDDGPQGRRSINKKNKRDKKPKPVEVVPDPSDESDDDQHGSKKSSKNRKAGAGGGTQGRESKQKNVKKKYVPGMKKAGSKAAGEASGKNSIKPATVAAPQDTKEPLVFMTRQEIIATLSEQHRDCQDEFIDAIASMIESDINKSYRSLARKTLDEFLATSEPSLSLDTGFVNQEGRPSTPVDGDLGGETTVVQGKLDASNNK